MAIRCEFLHSDTFAVVYPTFVEAFADYAIDMSYMSESSFRNRAIKNGLDVDSSVGVFDGGRMVGFTLVGLDDWKGGRAAFDIATGLIPAYRGRAIAAAMFEFALPRLRAKGVERFVLEVLQENEAAIRSYRKAGFEVAREFDCYQANPQDCVFGRRPDVAIEMGPLDRDRLGELAAWLDWLPSWENSLAAMKRIPDDLLLIAARRAGELIGAVAYYDSLGWITTLAVDGGHRRHGVATELLRRLVERLAGHDGPIKVVNVQADDAAFGTFLRWIGFAVYARQYEMELSL
jgi:ribosomal protein S18 acetylase RimI-like enzyme